jgi:voltage-gated potassium channel
MEQVKISEGAPLAGRTIVQANLRQRFGVIVVGIQRTDGRMEFNPEPDSTMHPGDFLVVLGRAANLRGLEAAAAGEAVTKAPASA